MRPLEPANSGIEVRIAAFDRGRLADLVRQATNSNTVEPGSFSIQAINNSLGPATGGLYRVAGTGRDQREEVDWSLILKVITTRGYNGRQASHDIDHPLYWKREVLAYRSGLLNNLPGGLRTPRCLSIIKQPDDSYWLWLEEVREEYGLRWPLEQYARAARCLGRFNGAYLAHLPMPSCPWLVRSGSPRGTLQHSGWDPNAVSDTPVWKHPWLRSAFPTPIAERVLRLWAEKDMLLDAFERLPQTLCHHDAWRRNMFAAHDMEGQERLVLIDWAYVGKGSVGLDAGDLFAASFSMFGVEPLEPAALDRVIFNNYLEGLRAAGWQGDANLARFGMTALASLKYTFLLPWLCETLDESKHAFWEHLSGHSMREFVHQQAHLITYLLEMADEARSLI